MTTLTLPNVPGLAEQPTAVRAKLVEIGERRGWDVDGMAGAIAHESGWNPSAVNKNNGASGFIQWTRETAPLYGTTVEQIRRMPATEQLDLAERYWLAASGGKPIGRLDFLVLGLGTGNVPGGYRASLADSTILYAPGTPGARGNPGLQDATGAVTVGTARAALARVLSGLDRIPVVAELDPLGPEGTKVVAAAAGAELLFWVGMGLLAVSRGLTGKRGRRGRGRSYAQTRGRRR